MSNRTIFKIIVNSRQNTKQARKHKSDIKIYMNIYIHEYVAYRYRNEIMREEEEILNGAGNRIIQYM